jgi:hypothetical protein
MVIKPRRMRVGLRYTWRKQKKSVYRSKGSDHFGKLRIDKRLILRWILQK